MDKDRIQRIEDLFHAAREHDPQHREAFLEDACGGDPALRDEVETLLEHSDRPTQSLHDAHAGEIATSMFSGAMPEMVGTRIGPYKLLEQIGEGGFGVVFMAEQVEPVTRKVALKVIKLGMDTKQVIARFEAERQALAMMDHPNIARVLDAGATDEGRPYFVMEYVRGEPITDYCDKNNLTVRERLDLFTEVCHAVQHAHQKGIIHRDIKPTNVLVTMVDGRPVPKVIDFGIAKATNARLTEKTLFTEHRQMIGTPEYMSPEQAEMSGVDIDTRSDVYSLGVLLYELLTGVTPFDAKQLREAGYGEIQRIIREEEPAKPSTRLSTLGDQLSGVAAHRRTEPRKLGTLVRGELDWIVMRCLEKDRTRRYETANGLAMDVLRHLNDEPVEASPPSHSYRLHKLVRRNKGAFAAAALVFLALILGVIGTSYGLVHAEQARASEAEQRRIAEERESEAIAAKYDAERTSSVLSQQNQQMLKIFERMFAEMGLLEELSVGSAEGTYSEIFVAGEGGFGLVFQAVRRADASLKLRFDRRAGGSRSDSDDSVVGVLGTFAARVARGVHVIGRIVEELNVQFSSQPIVRAQLLQMIADIVAESGELNYAAELFRQASGIHRHHFGDEHPVSLESTTRFANSLLWQGEVSEAADLFAELMHTYLERGDEMHAVAERGNLSKALLNMSEFQQAEHHAREVLRTLEEVEKPSAVLVAETKRVLGSSLVGQDRAVDAEVFLISAVAAFREMDDGERWRLARAESALGECLLMLGRVEEGEPLLLKSYNTLREARGDAFIDTRAALARLIRCYEQMGRTEDAARFQARHGR